MENLHAPDCIRTFTGLYMNVFEPTPEMICIEDIAHALSQQCRFGGHLPEFYSVAQHSVMCSLAVGPADRLVALMHDASEAYLLDIPRPIKARLSDYKEIEDKLMRAIASKFGFEYPMSTAVKTADDGELHFEWYHLMLQEPFQPGVTLISWDPKLAKAKFLAEFHKLKAQ